MVESPIWWEAVVQAPGDEDWLIMGRQVREVAAVEGHVGRVVWRWGSSQVNQEPTRGSAADQGVRPTLLLKELILVSHYTELLYETACRDTSSRLLRTLEQPITLPGP